MTKDKTSRMGCEIDADTGEVRADRRVRVSGNSLVVSLPPTLLDTAGIERDDNVEIVASSETEEIRIRPTTTNE